MKDLLHFLIKEITGSDKFEIEESQDGNRVSLIVRSESSLVGLIIGKGGKTIKNIRKILSVKATQDGTVVSISVNP